MTKGNRVEVLYDQSICKWKVYNFDRDNKWIYADSYPTQQDAVVDGFVQYFKMLDDGLNPSIKCFEKSYEKFDISEQHAWYKQAVSKYNLVNNKGERL